MIRKSFDNGSQNNPNQSKDESPPVRVGDGGDKTYREWLSLRELSVYADISDRTLRSWIYSPTDPLPAVKVAGKVLVRRSDFDRYLERHRVKPLAAIDVDDIVREVLGGASNGR